MKDGRSTSSHFHSPLSSPFERSPDIYRSTSSADTIAKQKAIVKNLRQSLGRQQEFFKSVYKSTFNLARTPGQRSLPLENAIEYWRLLFVEPSVNWGTPKTPWLEWWIEYLETSWKKAISKDMWDQAAVFVLKSLEDETMSWWSEDGAWPGVLDEFVRFVEEKRKAGAGAEDGKMDIA